jgi:nucleotide-binding universal stress UspA family protein
MAPKITLERGHKALTIIERVKERGRALFLTGTRGRGFVEELFLGSVAYNVARRAPLALLFVPAQGRERRANE